MIANTSPLGPRILGVAGQNAANGQLARTRGLNRARFLESLSATWSRLDPGENPFARSLAGVLRAHDDRADFLAGIDLILRGIDFPRRRLRLLTSTCVGSAPRGWPANVLVL